MIRAVYSIYAWAIFTLCFLLAMPCIILALATLPRQVTWNFAGVVFRLTLLLNGMRVRVEGYEKLDPDKAYILVGNHVSFLDPFFWIASVRRPVIGFEKKENFKKPIYGWMTTMWGNLAVTRGDTDKAKQDLAKAGERLKKRPELVVFFPEGTRSRTGEVGPFKKGGFHFAQDMDLEVAPFTQMGAHEVAPTGKWWFSPGEVVLRIHDPEKVRDGDDLNGFAERIREIVRAPLLLPVRDARNAG